VISRGRGGKGRGYKIAYTFEFTKKLVNRDANKHLSTGPSGFLQPLLAPLT